MAVKSVDSQILLFSFEVLKIDVTNDFKFAQHSILSYLGCTGSKITGTLWVKYAPDLTKGKEDMLQTKNFHIILI